jgi:hypothetical protein
MRGKDAVEVVEKMRIEIVKAEQWSGDFVGPWRAS